MDNISQSDAYEMVLNFINTLAGNLQVPEELDKYSSLAPKANWIEPLIEDLKAALFEMDEQYSEIVPVPVSNPQHADWNTVSWHLDSLIRDIAEDLSYHDGIRSSDDQYEDPQEWWLRPLVNGLKKANDNIDSNIYTW